MRNPTQPIGRFSIPLNLVRDHREIVQKFMREVVVLDARMNYGSDTIDYVALSDLFEPVDFGISAPHYDLEFLATERRYGDSLRMELSGGFTLKRASNQLALGRVAQ